MSAPRPAPQWPGFSIVFFDCDSTLVGIEGIDELAKLKGLGEEVAAATRRAMDGISPLEAVYRERLERLELRRADLKTLADLYRGSLVPDARETVAGLQAAGCSVFLVSGGLLAAIQSLARELAIPVGNARAVAIEFDELTGDWWQSHLRPGAAAEARYLAFAPTPLSETRGKMAVIREIVGPPPGSRASLLVGDGITDWEAREAVRLFVGFGGVVRRSRIADSAQVYIEDSGLAAVLPLALSPAQAARLSEPALRAALGRGLAAIREGRVRFRDPALRERLLAAHSRAA